MQVEPELLPWDTQLFAFPVGRVDSADIDDSSLRSSLERARDKGMRLVYWFARHGRVVSEALLNDFGGRLTDHKATFTASLSASEPAEGPDIQEYQGTAPPPDLIELAMAAGEHSRFKVDPHMPSALFEKLYTTWIERSVRHEIADVVLVSPSPQRGPCRGMITVAKQADVGVIGLAAIVADGRGIGLGTALVDRAHRWMLGHGLSFSKAVTQLDNAAACKLFAKCGYQLESVVDVYHFWPR